MGSSTCPVLTCKGGIGSGSGEREGRPPCGVLSALFNSSYFGRSPSGPSCVFGEIVSECVRGEARGARRAVTRRPLAAGRAVFSLTGRIFPRKKRGARAPGVGGDVLGYV